MDNISVEDISKAVIREYLYQNKLFKTYETLEKEDSKPTGKITKSSIVKNLCLEHLVCANKKSGQPLKSLL